MYFSTGMTVFFVVFAAVFALILFMVFRTVLKNAQDRRQPQIPVPARVVARRNQVWGGAGDSAAHTRHYVTFEFANGQRLELAVPDTEAGYLVEGDTGVLTFQGSLFVSFERGLYGHSLDGDGTSQG